MFHNCIKKNEKESRLDHVTMYTNIESLSCRLKLIIYQLHIIFEKFKREMVKE